MKTIGYARVSTRDQDLKGQVDALRAAGAEAIYPEKVSGVKAERPELAKLMRALEPGDTVVVTKLDRLGRSTRELLELIHRISQGGRLLQVAWRSALGHDDANGTAARHATRRHCRVRT